jgi:hypothetical protein
MRRAVLAPHGAIFFAGITPLHAVSLTHCSNRGDSALGVALTPNPSPSSRRGEYGVRKRSFRPTLKLTLQHSKSGGSMECGSEASAQLLKLTLQHSRKKAEYSQRPAALQEAQR